jgi:hypothetical protein
MGEIRPDLSASEIDTVGVKASVGFTELGEFMLASFNNEQADVTGIPAETPAPFADQHDDSQASKLSPNLQHDRNGWGSPYESGIEAYIRAARKQRQRRPN